MHYPWEYTKPKQHNKKYNGIIQISKKPLKCQEKLFFFFPNS